MILTFVAFSPALNNDFINWDDPFYVVNNALVHQLSLNNIRQIFSTYILGNYQPLTILHFAVDYHFFGLNPLYYHLTNILLHLLNIVLVYIFICLLSGRRLIALLTSLFFALHPIRVESVVWITERKDVLFAFFYLLGLIQYLRYLTVHRERKKYIIYTFLCFLFSLFSKPSAISFPLALFLLDYIRSRRMTFLSLSEKLPFFLVAFAFGSIAIFGTYTPTNEAYPVIDTFIKVFNQTITPLDEVKLSEEIFSFSDRFIIACHALILYAVKIIDIGHLNPYYPMPQKIDGRFSIDYYIAFFLILLLTWIVFRWRNKTFRFGIFFFVTTIFFNLPVSRIGTVEIADRFTYIPHIGLFYLLALSFEESFKITKLPHLHIVIKVLFSLLLITYAINTFVYTHTWKDSERLWSNVIMRYPNDIKGYLNRGNYYFENREYQKAIKDYLTALNIEPNNHRILYNTGNCFLYLNNPELALQSYDRALHIKPDYTKVLQNKAIATQLLK
jgi:hypothetical protein